MRSVAFSKIFLPRQCFTRRLVASPTKRCPSSIPLCEMYIRHSNALPMNSFLNLQSRFFNSEAEYNGVADETLESIQDAIDGAFDSTSIEYELSVASGVLTLSLPPNGTWVINKQTPNKQIWWSSPLSGPKRYEYDEKDRLWFSTKDGLSLGPFLVQEIRRFYPQIENFDISV